MPINAFMTDRPTTTVMADGGVGRKKPGAELQPVTQPVAAQSVNTGAGNAGSLRAAYEASKTPAAPAQTVQAPAQTAQPVTAPTPEHAQAEPEGLSPYEARELASYMAQEDAVNRLYEARQRSRLAGLRSAYEQSLADYQNAREDIAPVFEAQRNATAAESERQRAAFNEYAAARGLNSGAGGQAELARGNVLAGNLNALNLEQAKQETQIDRAIAALKAQYQSQIAQAKADNDYQRLSELLTEYRQQEQSLVAASQNQADEDYRAWAAQYNAYRDSVADQQYADQFAYQKERDAVSDNQWKRQFALAKAKSAGSSGGSGRSSASSNTAAASQSASPIEHMLALGNDGEAYAYLLSLGYRTGDTENIWQLYKEAKGRQKVAAQAAEKKRQQQESVANSAYNSEGYWRGLKNASGNAAGDAGNYARAFDSYADYRAGYNADVAKIYSADGPQVLSRNQWQRLKNTRQPGDGWETNYNSYEEYVRAFNEGYLKAYGG